MVFAINGKQSRLIVREGTEGQRAKVCAACICECMHRDKCRLCLIRVAWLPLASATREVDVRLMWSMMSGLWKSVDKKTRKNSSSLVIVAAEATEIPARILHTTSSDKSHDCRIFLAYRSSRLRYARYLGHANFKIARFEERVSRITRSHSTRICSGSRFVREAEPLLITALTALITTARGPYIVT